MPVPARHLSELSGQLDVHAERLRSLREQEPHAHPDHVGALSLEAAGHAVALELGRDRAILSLLDELHDDPRVAESFVSDPDRVIRDRGIVLPEGTRVEPSTGHGPLVVRVHVPVEGGSYAFEWHAETGFSQVQEPSGEAETLDGVEGS
jgi:hypothetical protein